MQIYEWNFCIFILFMVTNCRIRFLDQFTWRDWHEWWWNLYDHSKYIIKYKNLKHFDVFLITIWMSIKKGIQPPSLIRNQRWRICLGCDRVTLKIKYSPNLDKKVQIIVFIQKSIVLALEHAKFWKLNHCLREKTKFWENFIIVSRKNPQFWINCIIVSGNPSQFWDF